MSPSIPYNDFGLVGYEYVFTQYAEGNVIFFVKRQREKIRCQVCHSRDVIFRGTIFRRFRTVPLGSKKVFLDCGIQRVECRRCEKVRQEKTGFADWLKKARALGIRMLIKFANTLAAYKSGILVYYDFRISSGPPEGTNNKIIIMKRTAHGFRDMDFFKLKILALHETK